MPIPSEHEVFQHGPTNFTFRELTRDQDSLNGLLVHICAQAMGTTVSDTAIIVFSRKAEHETQSKLFTHNLGWEKGLSLSQKLVAHTSEEVVRSGLPSIFWGEEFQVETSFGERLAAALEHVFEHGYQKAIVVGTDIPDLSATHLLTAKQLLENQDLVLGPAEDGGVYLIGIRREAYHRTSFLSIAWETSAVQSGWKAYTQWHKTTYSWLEMLADLDRSEDLQFYIKHAHNQAFKVWLLEQFFRRAENWDKAESFSIASSYQRHLSLRAPPVFMA